LLGWVTKGIVVDFSLADARVRLSGADPLLGLKKADRRDDSAVSFYKVQTWL